MKYYVVALLAALSSPAVKADNTIRLSEPVAKTEHNETFGSELDTRLPQVSLAALEAQPQNYLNTPFQVTTRIAKVCQKKGCFFIAQQDDVTIRVSFKDYGFFIPSDSGGKEVTLAGTLIKKTMSADQAAHFRADLNDSSPSLVPGEVYEIVAHSIRIPLRS